MLTRRMLLSALAIAAAAPAQADTAPDEMILRLTVEVIDAVKADKAIQAGDVGRILSLVDAKVMPLVNFPLMTRSAVGRRWNEATPEQHKRLQTVELKGKPLKLSESQVEVRTLVVGGKEPIPLSYRLENSSGSWKIFDVNVLGVWLVENYRTRFAQEISAGGIDGLITFLAGLNKGAAKG